MSITAPIAPAAWRCGLRLLALLLCLSLAGMPVLSQQKKPPPEPTAPLLDAMRGTTPIDKESAAPLIYSVENKDVRRTRQYAMQPPTIPHSIDGYQVDKDFNRCMFCHSRTAAEAARSIPVSITHYMDRDNNVLADVSPRRYFCTQCHVPQADAKPLVGNNFVDVEQLLQRKPGVMGSSK